MSAVERILKISHENGYTQASLAEKLNEFGVVSVKKQTITDWKAGKSNSYLMLLKELSQILNVSIDYLICGENSDTTLSDNEKEFLNILNRLKNPIDQAKLIGYADCYADKLLDERLNNEGADAQQRFSKTS
ncbi:MAG: helix-turn-helix transcriptional regulator [Clostridia bacterium]|nr:helix-turn-helix transcriptional regulator [Clostridia bacterium]